MYIFVSGGKTMGHISPLLGIILALNEDYNFIYFGLKDSMEEDVCIRYNINFHPIKVIPFNRKNILLNFKTIYLILKEKKNIKKRYKNYNVKCIITSGGFVSIPLVLSFKKINKILLESNTTLGLANRFLLRYVNHLGVQFNSIKHKKSISVGNPIKIFDSNFDHQYFYQKEKPILFVGGSIGAKDIISCAFEFNKKYPLINLIVITGNKYNCDYEFNSNVKLYKSIKELSGILNKFSVVVSRAGGSTITELLLSNTPFVLFPSKNVSANHQELNAIYLYKFGACEIIRDNSNESIDKIYQLKNDLNKRKLMLENQEKLKIDDSIERIKKLIT